MSKFIYVMRLNKRVAENAPLLAELQAVEAVSGQQEGRLTTEA